MIQRMPHDAAAQARRRHVVPAVDDPLDEPEERSPSRARFRSSSAESAGVSVSALNAESATENAIVSENCW